MKNFSAALRLAIALSALILCALPVAMQGDAPSTLETIGLLCGSTMLGITSLGFNRQDANLSISLALPATSNNTVTSTAGIDTAATTASDFLAECEFVVSAPALNTTLLPNTATESYSIVASPNSNMAGAVVVSANVLVQTGASGAGAAAATARCRLPAGISTNYGRYVGLQCASATANIANSAGVSATLAAQF